MVYPHKWSPITYRLSAGQGKFAGRRPTFYRCATQPRPEFLPSRAHSTSWNRSCNTTHLLPRRPDAIDFQLACYFQMEILGTTMAKLLSTIRLVWLILSVDSDVARGVHGLCVCLCALGTLVSCAKTAELIEILFFLGGGGVADSLWVQGPCIRWGKDQTNAFAAFESAMQ